MNPERHENNISYQSQTSSGEKKIKGRKDEAKYTIKKREMKNLESYQQAVMLALINAKCSFTIESPGKHSKVTVTMPRLTSLTLNNQEIDISQLALHQSQMIMKTETDEGLSQTTALRRFEKNKKIFTENFLFDTCLELGFWFDSKQSRKSKKSQQMERIFDIFYGSKHIMDQTKLLQLGSELNTFFFSQLTLDKKVTFEINHPKIIEILQSHGINLTEFTH